MLMMETRSRGEKEESYVLEGKQSGGRKTNPSTKLMDRLWVWMDGAE
jgi:hypothetical protein